MNHIVFTTTVEQRGTFEASTSGFTEGNPFEDFNIQCTFTSHNETKTVAGFYDGEGRYIVRFIPSFEGN